MKSISLGILLVMVVAPCAHASEPIPSKRYDRDGNGVIDERESRIRSLHEQDTSGMLAKYDTNFNGRIDPPEALQLSRDSMASLPARLESVQNDALFFAGRKVSDVDRVSATRPPPAAPMEAKPPKGGCEEQQRLFVRRDRLDTYQFRNSTFIEGFVPRTKAAGASVSLSRDDIERVDSAVINGRVSYVLNSNDPMSPCFDTGSSDPYAKRDFNSPFLFGSIVALWGDAQGTINAPRAKSERSALKAGVDAQATIAGGSLFDLQYLIATPYAQTDFRGETRAYGFTAAWEPIARNFRLGGSIGAPPSEYLDWYWQVRAEADVKRVDAVGATSLTRADYVWGGGTARVRLTPFPDTSIYNSFGASPFPSLTDRLYADITVHYYREFDKAIEAFQWSAEVGVNITPTGDASVSLRYSDGVDKDTLIKARQYLLALNYKL